MPSLKSILSLLALSSVMVDNPVPQRIISRILCVVALVVFSSVVVGALLLAAIIYGHQALVAHGYTPLDAGLYIIGGLAVASVVAGLYTLEAVKNLMTELKTGLKKSVPLGSQLANEATNVVEAFINGFLNRHNKSDN